MQTMMKPKSIVFYPIISHLSLIEISEFSFKKVSFIRNWILKENTVEKPFVLNRAFFLQIVGSPRLRTEVVLCVFK